MAFVLVVLLLLELHCQLAYSRNITISDDGNSSDICCVDGQCDCSSLYQALQKIKSDTTIINITSSQVFLPTNVIISDHSTIDILGNNDTVITCNQTGYVTFLNCKNVSISGITWDRCGGAYLAGAILVNHTDNLSVSTCKFQKSLAYGIAIEAVSGVITIADTEILNNSVLRNSAGGLHLQQTTEDAQVELNIINCIFKFNGYKSSGDGSDGGAIKIDTVGVTSMLNVSIENSVISDNHANRGGAIYLYAEANNLTIKFNNVTFTGNSALGGGDSIYYFTKQGENASFIITGGSSIVGYSRDWLHFATNLTTLIMENVTINHNGEGYMLLYIETYSENSTIGFYDVNLLGTRVQLVLRHPEACFVEFNKLIASHYSSLQIDGSEGKGFQCNITNCQFLNNNASDVAVVNIINKHPYDPNGNPAITQIINSSFVNNSYGSSNVVSLEFNGDGINVNGTPAITRIINSSFTDNNHGSMSVVAILYDNDGNSRPLGDVQLSSTTFANNIDNDNTLYLYYCNLIISNEVIFRGNTAIKGAGIYFTNFSTALIDSYADFKFADNTAALGGGAIYAEFAAVPNSVGYCYPWLLFYTTAHGEYTANFSNNHAHAAGNSIFFSIPSDGVDCVCRNSSSSDSLMYIPSQFNYTGSNEIATSPYSLQLGPPAVCSGLCSDGGTYQVKDIMLGEYFSVVTRMLDYYNNTAEPTLFQLRCSENCQNYSLTGLDEFEYKFVETNNTMNISIIGHEVKTNSIIGLEMSSVVATINSYVRTITVKIEVTIIPCQIGYVYNSDSQKRACVCNRIDGIIECELDSIKIKRGYWYGKIDNTIVVGLCPNDYCKYGSSCKSSENFCDLSKFSDNQCNQYRTGPACGKCQNNYTLAYDSNDCIPDSHCSAWWTAGIVILTMIYWVTVSFTIIFMMYFITAPTMLGYVYGITYFYSVIDLLVSNDLPISDGMIRFIEILSGLVNLTPRFLGSLCLVKGLSGIDQQVIHYIHPVAIALLLFLIPKLAKCCDRVSDILNRVGTARSMCLLLLLCYTSISSTSLNLITPSVFQGTRTLYTYFSPDIKYFTGRHIIYGIVAILLTIVIALGFPIFLLLQPLLRRCQRIQFIKIQHILDQFQQCYKKEYHWAAAMYLICRLLVYTIVSVSMVNYVTSYFVLQVLCFVVAVLHILLRPYKNDAVNSLDHIILLIAVMVVSLNTNSLFISLSTDTAVNDFVVAIFVLLPLISFIGFLVLKRFKEKFSRLDA